MFKLILLTSEKKLSISVKNLFICFLLLTNIYEVDFPMTRLNFAFLLDCLMNSNVAVLTVHNL